MIYILKEGLDTALKQIIILLSFTPLFAFAINGGFDENFYKASIEEKRKIFIKTINELLDKSFEKIKAERDFVDSFFEKNAKTGFRELKKDELNKLIELKEKYRVKNLFDYKEYKKRISTVPKSMGIAQAMVESATGTSRFTKEANNLFGEWTWGEKGIIPKQRAKGKTHKIRIFDSLQESVDSYLLNLNRNHAYEEFRELRAKFMQKNEKLSGLEAVKTLVNYSEIREKYVKILTTVIEKNELNALD